MTVSSSFLAPNAVSLAQVPRLPASRPGAPVTAEILLGFGIFAELSGPERARLLAQMQPLTVPARTILLAAGQPGHAVYFLLEGSVKICLERPTGPRTQKIADLQPSIQPSNEVRADFKGGGTQVMINLCGPGTVLGELSVIDGLGHSANVLTREPCRLLWMDKEFFLEAVQQMPELYLALLRECSARLRNATDQLHAFATLDAAGRVAHALLRLAQRCGVQTPEGVRLDIGLTQPEIADLTGMTRTRAATVIGVFKKNGWLSQHPDNGGPLLLRDIASLSAVAHLDITSR